MTIDEEFCSVGLLNYAGADDEATALLAKIIREQFPDRCYDLATTAWSANPDIKTIVNFNDNPLTTFEEVELCFSKAEVAWDERV